MHVLVVGAGPTGLTLARALHQRGISVRQIDAAMQSAPTSRAFGIQARTLEVLDRFRLAESVLAAAHTIDGVSLHVSSGRPALVDFQRVHPRFPPIVLLAQTQTERFLTECDRQPERGVTFGGLDGRAALLSHADGREERVEADWIVGCDGAHSAVRKAIAAAFPGDQFPVHAVLADGVCEGLDRRRIHLFPGPRRMLAWFPLPAPAGKALWRAIALVPADAPPPPTTVSSAPFHTPGVGTIDAIEWYSSFRISARQVPFVRRDRVLLCGDAAHIHSPAGGQGMNLGIQDAWSLAAALPRGGKPVDAWATQRHAVATRVLKATNVGTRMMISRDPFVALFRRAAANLLAVSPLLSRRVTRALAGLDYPPLPD